MWNYGGGGGRPQMPQQPQMPGGNPSPMGGGPATPTMPGAPPPQPASGANAWNQIGQRFPQLAQKWGQIQQNPQFSGMIDKMRQRMAGGFPQMQGGIPPQLRQRFANFLNPPTNPMG